MLCKNFLPQKSQSVQTAVLCASVMHAFRDLASNNIVQLLPDTQIPTAAKLVYEDHPMGQQSLVLIHR